MAFLAKASTLAISSRSLVTSRHLLKDKNNDREMYEKMRLKYEAQKLGLGPQGALNPLTGRPISRSRGVSFVLNDWFFTGLIKCFVRMNLGFNFQQYSAVLVLFFFILCSSGWTFKMSSHLLNPILIEKLQGRKRLGRVNWGKYVLPAGHRKGCKRGSWRVGSKHRILWEARLGLCSSQSSPGGAEKACWRGE